MSNTTLKSGLKFTISTDNGIFNTTNNKVSVAEVSGPVMNSISNSFDNITSTNRPQLRVGATNSKINLQLGVYENSSLYSSVIQSSYYDNGLSSYTTGFLLLNPDSGAFGNVGIGTTNPLCDLHINGTSGLTIPVGTSSQRPNPLSRGTIRYNTTTAQFEGYDGNVWSGLGGVVDILQNTKITAAESTSNQDNTLRFFTSGAIRQVIDNAGRVGINTTTPAFLLNIHTPSANNGLYISNTDANSNGMNYLFNSHSTYGLIFQEYDSSDNFKRNLLTINKNTGEVGIGTNSAESGIHIYGSENRSGNAFASISLDGAGITKAQSNRPGIYHRSDIGLGIYSDFKMTFEVDGTAGAFEAMRLTDSGLLQIGTNTTSVSGNVKLQIADRMELAGSNSLSTGIWFNRTFGTERNFIGNGKESDGGGSGPDGLGFWMNSEWRFSFTESGSMGIGVTVPRTKLHVDGSLYLAQNAVIWGMNKAGWSHGGYLSLRAGGTGTDSSESNRYTWKSTLGSEIYLSGQWDNTFIAFKNQDQHRMRITHNGYVGIGTTNPTYKLTVGGDINLLGSYAQDIANPKIVFSEGTTNPDMYIQYVGSQGTGSTGNRLRFGSGNSGWESEAMSIRGDGNISIGKSNRSAFFGSRPLSIGRTNAGSTTIYDMICLHTYRGDFSSTPGGSAIVFENRDSNNYNNYGRIKCMTVNDWDYGDNDEAASNFIFQLTNGGSAGDRMIITGRGAVGIGTMNPRVSALHLYRSSYGEPLRIQSGSYYMDVGPGSSSWVYFETNTGSGFYFWKIVGTNHSFRAYTTGLGFLLDGYSNYELKIERSNQINTYNSHLYLQWTSNKEVKIRSHCWIHGTLYYYGASYRSDSRIKTNITDASGSEALDIMRKIKAKRYDYVDVINYDKTWGWIAQQVKEICPDFVEITEGYIPNIMKYVEFDKTVIKDPSGNEDDKYLYKIKNFRGNNDIDYKFYENYTNNTTNQDYFSTCHNYNEFILDENLNTLFMFGYKVNDFHRLKKDKLQALVFSAVKEIDKLQQTHFKEMEEIKTQNQQILQENIDLKQRIERLEKYLSLS